MPLPAEPNAVGDLSMSPQDPNATATLARASELLDLEYESSQVSKPQRLWFFLLQLFAHLLPPLIAALLLIDRIDIRSLKLARPYLIRGVFICLLLVLLLLVLNLPLIGKTIRQVRLSHKLGSLRLAEYLWATGSQQVGARGRAVLILSTPVALLALFLFNLVRRQVSASGPGPSWAEVAAVLFVCVGLQLSLYGLDRLLDRLRGRLAYAREVLSLRRTLTRQATSTTEFEISRELALRMSNVERLHILQQRALALSHAGQGRTRGLLTAKRPQVTQVLKELSLDARLKVEDRIEALSTDPSPADATPAPDDASWTLRVPQTALEIVYSVDRPAGRIEILSVESLPEEAPNR